MAKSTSAKTKVDLESAYQLYPRKEGKSVGMKRLAKVVKTPEDLDLLKKAIQNYVLICQRDRKERTYIKLWSTFSSCWEDYLNTADLGIPDSEELEICAQYQGILVAGGFGKEEASTISLQLFDRAGDQVLTFLQWFKSLLSSPKVRELERSDKLAFRRYVAAAIRNFNCADAGGESGLR